MTFNVRYKPETKYDETIQQTSEVNLKYIGSEEFLQKLKDKGLQNPTITNNDSKREIVVKTGKLVDKNSFPLTMEFVNTISSDGKKAIPDGTLISGIGTMDKMPVLNSIVSESLDEDYKKALLETLQGMLSQLSFPVKEMKVGDSFSQESPLSIPIAETTIKMAITTTYILTGVSANKGYLDVNIVYTMESDIFNYDVRATGSGKGSIIYDIKNSFISRYETINQIEMLFKTKNFDMEIKSTTGFTQTVRISDN
jgi:hypothetical protein